MYKVMLFSILIMISLSFGKESQENQIQPIHPDSMYLVLEPLSVDTIPSKGITIQSNGKAVQKKQVTSRDVSRARGWRAGGITMICVGATGIALPGTGLTMMIFAYDPFFILPASATIAAGTAMIIGGAKMIKKGNSIDGVQVGIAPVVDPWNDRYGAQLSLSF